MLEEARVDPELTEETALEVEEAAVLDMDEKEETETVLLMLDNELEPPKHLP